MRNREFKRSKRFGEVLCGGVWSIMLHLTKPLSGYFSCTGGGNSNAGGVLPRRFAASAFKRSTAS